MAFEVKDSLSEQELEVGLKYLIKDGMAYQAMVTLTSGVILAAFAVQLGASNVVIGLLAATPFLMQLLQLPSISLVEKVRNRRTVVVYAALPNRLSLTFLVLIPILFTGRWALIVLLGGVLVHTGFLAVSSCGWNSWMSDLVPRGRLGSFFSKRLALSIALGIVLSLGAGFFLDWWKGVFPGQILYSYSILFFVGMVAGVSGVYFLSRVPEPRMVVSGEAKGLLRRLASPFKNRDYRKLVFFLGWWNFAINLAAPFFTVYLLKRLEMEMSTIIALSVLSQVMNVAFLRLWGRVSDHFSNKAVLGMSGPLFLFCILAWPFTTMPGMQFLTIPLLVGIHVLSGISLAGTTLAAGNIGLKCAPKGEATAYLAAATLVSSVAAGIAPIVGGVVADYCAERHFAVLFFREWDFLFLFAFAVGIFSIFRLAMVKEVGEIKEKISIPEFMTELRREVRSISTARGMRYMVQFPVFWAKGALQRRKGNNDDAPDPPAGGEGGVKKQGSDDRNSASR